MFPLLIISSSSTTAAQEGLLGMSSASSAEMIRPTRGFADWAVEDGGFRRGAARVGVTGYQLSHGQKFLARIKRKIYKSVDRTRNGRFHDKDMLAGRY
jgi:hypothetical protein